MGGRRSSTTLALVATLLGVGCVSGAGEPPSPLPGSSAALGDAAYPEVEHGTSVGQIIPPYVFDGYVNSSEGIGADFVRPLSLADFYNPTGDQLYGEDSPFEAGTPKPRGLVINVSAVWCGPCKFEAQEVLPGEYAKYEPLGGELLLVLADSQNPGEAASFSHLDGWTTAFDVQYPAVIDPRYQLGALFDQSQFPANFLIDTRTMQIVAMVVGIPAESFWSQLDALLED